MPLTGIQANIVGRKPDLQATIQVSDTQARGLIDRVMLAVSAMSLEAFLMGPAHGHFEDEIVQRFAYQGDRQVGHWPDLTDATQNIRSQQGFGPDWPINIRTEEMFRALTHHADFFMFDGEAEMVLPGNVSGSVAKKIRTAQEGSDNNPMGFGPTPPRPVLAADEGDMASLLTLLNGWIILRMGGIL